MKAHDSQRWPTMAHDSKCWPTTANAGRRMPTKASKAAARGPGGGLRRETSRAPGRFSSGLFLILLTKTHYLPTGVPTQAHDSRRRPTMANDSKCRPMLANDSQRRPTNASKSRQISSKGAGGARDAKQTLDVSRLEPQVCFF